MTGLDRRTFLQRSGATAVGTAVLGGPFAGFLAGTAEAKRAKPDFRHLRPVPDKRDGVVRLWLPEGFRYRSFHDVSTGATLSDGTPVPPRHDGMAAFPRTGSGWDWPWGRGDHVVLVRNHEINGPGPAFGEVTRRTYDPMALGGTTTVVVTPHGRVVHSRVSLNGTQQNCAGGPMPWGSWVTCEETVNGPDVGNDFTGGDNSLLTEKHGYIYDVPSRGRSRGRPVRSAGRFAHEAAAYDPQGGALYLTEDNFGFPSGLYRYLPPKNPLHEGRLVDGGRLQMLEVRGERNADLSVGQRRRATYDVTWVDIDDPDPTFPEGTTNDEAIQAVGNQGRAQGAAIFARLEGAVYDQNKVYFVSTQGGEPDPADPPPPGFGDGRGQVWAYHARAEKLQLLYESPAASVLDFPDNVTTSPRGTLVLCEDGGGDNFLRGLTRGGQIFDFALNRIAGQEDDEFAGSTFSPDGETLFVNIQSSNAMSFAIWGPWRRTGF